MKIRNLINYSPSVYYDNGFIKFTFYLDGYKFVLFKNQSSDFISNEGNYDIKILKTINVEVYRELKHKTHLEKIYDN